MAPSEQGGSRGRFKPGQSGNPGGRPKGLGTYIREQVGDDGKKLVEFWLKLLTEKDVKLKALFGTRYPPRWQDRMAAAQELADRGFGRPVQALEHTGLDGGPISLTGLSREALAARAEALAARIRGDGDGR